jgi:putative ABC transport system permease protein
VVAGRWTPDEAGAISVEEGIAKTLNLKLGDTLRFDIGGVPTDARITSLRKVDWGSMRANFFVMYPVSQMPDVPITYMSAFRAPAQAAGFDNALVRRFPNITNVDMSATINQVQRVLDQVIRAVEFLFGFHAGAGWWCCLPPSPPRARSARASSRSCAPWARAPACCARCSAPSWLGVGLLAGFLASRWQAWGWAGRWRATCSS